MPHDAISPTGRFKVFHYHDAHEQAAMLQAWQPSYWQLSPGAFEGRVGTLDTGAVCVMVERLNRVLLQRGALPADCVAVGVPLRLAGHGMLAGRRSHLDGLHVFSGRDGFEYLSPATHLVVNIQFYPARLGHPALRDAVGRMAEQLGSQASVLDMEPAHMARLRQTLVTLLSSVAQTPDLLASPPVREAVERTLVHAVLDVLQAQADGDSAAPAPSRARSWQLVRAVRERMERAAQDCPLSVAELGDNLGVSRRTLQYAFQDALGMSPTTYLRAARLNRVRSALPDATSVTEAATRFGFWHFGHFSTEYRALFKERPSDTVRRCKAPSPQTPQAPSDGTWVSGDWLS